MHRIALAFATVLSICATGGSAASPADPRIAAGGAFAQSHCAACHAIPPVRISPNPESPPFTEIVAQPNLTCETLKAFLRDSHNYPEVMRFQIEPDAVDALASFMLSLRARPEMRPAAPSTGRVNARPSRLPDADCAIK